MEVEEAIDKISLITKRDSERKQGLQKRKEDKNNLAADNEKLGYFEETFMDKYSQTESLLSESEQIDKAQLPDHFNKISTEILLLQKYVANSNIFLRSYDVKKCQESLHNLVGKAKELETKLLPKKRFGFKNKPKPTSAPSTSKKSQDKDQVDSHMKTIVLGKLQGFMHKSNETLQMSGEDIFKKDVTAEHLNNCKVKFLGCPSTVHLNNLKNCHVFTGPVSTSVFAENCIDCTLVIACQQLRLHSSKDVKIYLHVTSRAIMEDCKNIKLAPYNLTYSDLDVHFSQSGLDRSTNNWQYIDDFNWLNIEKQSPNWSILDQEEFVEDWDM